MALGTYLPNSHGDDAISGIRYLRAKPRAICNDTPLITPVIGVRRIAENDELRMLQQEYGRNAILRDGAHR